MFDDEDHTDEEYTAEINKGWLITFTDLVSLMLAFFVLLFSMSSVNSEDWKTITESLSRSLAPDAGILKSSAGADLNIAGRTRDMAIDLGYLSAILESQMKEAADLGDNVIHQLEDRMVISLPSDVLFQVGAATLSEKGKRALRDMGSLLRNVGNRVDVFGHTDPTPLQGGGFSSNWELSISRAITVANELRRAGYPKDILAFGAAESHFEFLSPELSRKQRTDLSRRVDIVVLSSKGGRS